MIGDPSKGGACSDILREKDMINEILTEILAAERKAAEIKADGEKKASDTLANGEKTCAEIAKTAADEAKTARLAVLEEYAKKAEVEYARVLEESKKAGLALAESKNGATEKAAEEIYGRIINGDC